MAKVWPGWCAFPDFTNPKTRAWWIEKMAFYTEAGVDGFWTDMNEPASRGQCTPNVLEFDYEGSVASHRKTRNVYGMQMAKSTQQGSSTHLTWPASLCIDKVRICGCAALCCHLDGRQCVL